MINDHNFKSENCSFQFYKIIIKIFKLIKLKSREKNPFVTNNVYVILILQRNFKLSLFRSFNTVSRKNKQHLDTLN